MNKYRNTKFFLVIILFLITACTSVSTSMPEQAPEATRKPRSDLGFVLYLKDDVLTEYVYSDAKPDADVYHNVFLFVVDSGTLSISSGGKDFQKVVFVGNDQYFGAEQISIKKIEHPSPDWVSEEYCRITLFTKKRDQLTSDVIYASNMKPKLDYSYRGIKLPGGGGYKYINQGAGNGLLGYLIECR